MPRSDYEVNIYVDADDQASAKLKPVNKQVDNLGKGAPVAAKGVSAMGGSAKSMLRPMLLAGAATAAVYGGVRGFKYLINQGSALAESNNAISKVFGESAKDITDYGKTTAVTAGISRREFQQLATVTGAVLKNQGVSTKETAELTIELTKRAADMASVFDTDVKDALEAINSGLRGESEPLTRFGVDLRQTAVNAEGLRLGLAATNKELTEEDKALARVSLLMSQTEDISGDFVDTSDQLANSQRILTSVLGDSAAEIGLILLPAADAVSAILRDWAIWLLPKIPDLIYAVGDAFDALGTFLHDLDLPSKLRNIQDLAAPILDAIGEKGGEIWSAIGTKANEIWGVVGPKLAELRDNIRPVLTTIKNAAGAVWEGVTTKAGELKDLVTPKLAELAVAAQPILDGIKDKAGNVWTAFLGDVDTVKEAAGPAFIEVKDSFIAGLGAIKDAVIGGGGETGSSILSPLAKDIDEFSTAAELYTNDVGPSFGESLGAVRERVELVSLAIGGVAGGLGAGLLGKLVRLGNWLAENTALGGFIADLRDDLEPVVIRIAGKIGDFSSFLGEKFSATLDTVREGPLGQFVNTLKSFANIIGGDTEIEAGVSFHDSFDDDGAMGAYGEVAGSTFVSITTLAGDMLQDFKDIASWMGDYGVPAFVNFADAGIRSIIIPTGIAVVALLGVLGTLKDIVGEMLGLEEGEFGEWLLDLSETINEDVVPSWSDWALAIVGVKTALDDLRPNIVTFLGNIVEGTGIAFRIIGNIVGASFSLVGRVFGLLTMLVGQGVALVLTGIQEVIAGVLRGVVGMVNHIGGKVFEFLRGIATAINFVAPGENPIDMSRLNFSPLQAPIDREPDIGKVFDQAKDAWTQYHATGGNDIVQIWDTEGQERAAATQDFLDWRNTPVGAGPDSQLPPLDRQPGVVNPHEATRPIVIIQGNVLDGTDFARKVREAFDLDAELHGAIAR